MSVTLLYLISKGVVRFCVTLNNIVVCKREITPHKDKSLVAYTRIWTANIEFSTKKVTPI